VGRVSDARERIVEAAIELLWAQSYGLVSVDAICERADVKKGSFYYFFKSKDELVVAALDWHWQDRRASFDAIFSASSPPLERLQRYFDNIHERQRELQRRTGRVLGCFHASVGTECIRNSPAIAAKVQEILSIYKKYLESALRDAAAAGQLDLEDPAEQAQGLFAYVAGVLAQARIHDDLGFVKQLPEGSWRLLGLPALPLSKGRAPRAPRSAP
jgi:TetR/AcrR family transcriptional repressor of nem operon